MKSSVSHPAARRTRDLQVWGLSGRVFVPAKIRDLSRCPDGLYHLPPPGVSDFQTIYWIRRVRRMITSYLLMKNLTSPTPIWHHKSSLTVSNPLSLFFQWEHTLQIETASVNIHSRLTSHYPDRYHVWLTDFTRRFLFSCCETDSCEKLLAASPAASLKRSTNSDHQTHLQSQMFSEFQEEFFNQLLQFPFWWTHFPSTFLFYFCCSYRFPIALIQNTCCVAAMHSGLLMLMCTNWFLCLSSKDFLQSDCWWTGSNMWLLSVTNLLPKCVTT